MCEFEVQVVEHVGYGQKRPFCQLPRLVAKMTRLCAKLGSLHAHLTPPALHCTFHVIICRTSSTRSKVINQIAVIGLWVEIQVIITTFLIFGIFIFRLR